MKQTIIKPIGAICTATTKDTTQQTDFIISEKKIINKLIATTTKEDKDFLILKQYKIMNIDLIKESYNSVTEYISNNSKKYAKKDLREMQDDKQYLNTAKTKPLVTIDYFKFIDYYLSIKATTKKFIEDINEIEKEKENNKKENRYIYEWDKKELNLKKENLISGFNNTISHFKHRLNKKPIVKENFKLIKTIKNDNNIIVEYNSNYNNNKFNLLFTENEFKQIKKLKTKTDKLALHFSKHIKAEKSNNNKTAWKKAKIKQYKRIVFIKKFLRMKKGYFWNIDIMSSVLNHFDLNYSKEYLKNTLIGLDYSNKKGLGWNRDFKSNSNIEDFKDYEGTIQQEKPLMKQLLSYVVFRLKPYVMEYITSKEMVKAINKSNNNKPSNYFNITSINSDNREYIYQHNLLKGLTMGQITAYSNELRKTKLDT